MKKQNKAERRTGDRDTMRPEYDFSKGRRGVTAGRYAEGTNVVVVDPDVLDVFPDSASINQALRALAPVLRERRVHPPNKPLQPTRAAQPKRKRVASRRSPRG